MSPLGDLDGLRDAIATCMRCGNCQSVCPVYRELPREPAVARGKVMLAEALLEGTVEPSAELARQVGLCLACNACVEACPSGVPVDKIILAARAELARRRSAARVSAAVVGAARRPRVLEAGVAVAARLQGLALGRGPEESLGLLRLPVERGRRPVLPRLPARPLSPAEATSGAFPEAAGRVVFYPGCLITYVYPQIGRALIAALKSVRVEVALPATAQCCGVPMLVHGDVAAARTMARDTIRQLDDPAAEVVLTACPTCGSALKRHFADLLCRDPAWAGRAERLAGRTLDATEYLVERVDLPAARAARGGMVTYHDPCHLARGQGVREQPRELIRRVAGHELVELASREVCCGGAGSFLLAHARLAGGIGARKVQEVAASGAEVVVTGCPGCRLQLTDSLRRRGLRQRVCHTLELVAETVPAARHGDGRERASA